MGASAPFYEHERSICGGYDFHLAYPLRDHFGDLGSLVVLEAEAEAEAEAMELELLYRPLNLDLLRSELLAAGLPMRAIRSAA